MEMIQMIPQVDKAVIHLHTTVVACRSNSSNKVGQVADSKDLNKLAEAEAEAEVDSSISSGACRYRCNVYGHGIREGHRRACHSRGVKATRFRVEGVVRSERRGEVDVDTENLTCIDLEHLCMHDLSVLFYAHAHNIHLRHCHRRQTSPRRHHGHRINSAARVCRSEIRDLISSFRRFPPCAIIHLDSFFFLLDH